ncbi:inosine/xanthosine triphosphatase [Pseudomonas sp. P9_31]|uniref:inosine/xanthosine triphosphatase n=1 Tax=Pseudomonas sp. P9_31 TaxID=3043448 RepID=UPI002A36A95D|nr:inosine/xanthosine triphosphatase [Pseudomonas sp. P9_31]WPN60552.1 inosine/xanthosine triphosphatase [Pseudomonas sp. P9_31]
MKMQSELPVFVLATKNIAKINALSDVCGDLFGTFTLIPFDAESGVSETPTTDEEAIRGCLGRLESVQRHSNERADYYVALEGLVEHLSFGSFVYGWAAVKDRHTGDVFYGCSGKVMLPPEVVARIRPELKLSAIMQELYPETAGDMDLLGCNGIITAGMYSRVDEFKTALRCALGAALASDVGVIRQ